MKQAKQMKANISVVAPAVKVSVLKSSVLKPSVLKSSVLNASVLKSSVLKSSVLKPSVLNASVLTLAFSCLLTACGTFSQEKPATSIEKSGSAIERSGEKSGSSLEKTGGQGGQSGIPPGPGFGTGEKSAGAQEQKPVSVQVMTISLADVTPHLVLTGVVGALPDHLVKVTPAVPGKLKKVLVVEGQKVTKGDIVALLDDTHLSEQMRLADANVKAAETTIKQAEEAVSFAKANLERQEKLFQAEVSAKKEILVAQNQLQTSQLQVQTAQAQLQATKASREQTATELGLTKVRAPISGIVSSRYLNSNDSVDQNAAIAQIVGLDTVLISAALPADSPAKHSIGEKAKISSESEPNKEYDATITAISPIVDRVSNTIATQLLCPNLSAHLRDGQNVKVTVAAHNIGCAILVPQEALVPDPASPSDMMIYVVAAGKAKRVAVKCGIAQNGKVQIASGLSPGQTIIVQGAYGLPDNSPVQPVAAK